MLRLLKMKFSGWLLFVLLLSTPMAIVASAQLFNGASADLERLTVLKRVVYLVNENYVEPQRINAGEMFLAALKKLQEQIPEVRVFVPSSDTVTIQVNRERLSMSKEMVNIYSLTPALSKTLLFVKKNLVSKEVTDESLEQLAIHGILSTLDPHSNFLPKEIWDQTKTETLQSSFGGVGIVISTRNGKLLVIAPIDETPAARAGIQAGDHIVRIGEASTVNMDTNEAANLMRGPKGTVVKLMVMREGYDVAREFVLTRDVIRTQAVEHKPLEAGIHYIRIRNFQANTGEDVRRYLKAAGDKAPIKGVILDLRNDPGGLLTQAIDVADQFVSQGTIVSSVNRVNKENRREQAKAPGTYDNFPMVVLVNGGSASASEIVAGAIKYLDRGLVVGRRTFGKSSVQLLFDMPKDSALKLTIEKYLTSNGNSLQGVGIIPDIQLDPARFDGENFSLFGSSFHMGEEDLEGHLETSSVTPTNKEQPGYSLRYLIKKEPEEANEFIALKEPMKDFEIAFSWRLLSKSRFNTRKSLLKDLRQTVDLESIEQRKAITETLAKKNITWNVAKKNVAKNANQCGVPQVQIDVTGSTPGSVPVAGSEAQLTLKVNNTTKCTLTNFWAMSQAEDYFLNLKEFLVGTLLPGTSKSTTVKVKLPEYVPDRLMNVKFAFFEDEANFQLEKFKNFPVKALKQPRFTYVYRMTSKENKGQLGLETMPKLGDTVTLNLLVKNVGEGTSKDNIAILKNLSGTEIFLKNGRSELGELKPGATKELNFDFEIRPTFNKETVALELQVYDSQFGEYLTNKINFKINHPPLTGKFIAQPGYLKATGAAPLPVMSSLAPDAWSLTTLTPSTEFKTLGKWGNHYLVALDPSSNSCKEGWVAVATTGLITIKEPSKPLPPKIDCHMYEAPKIVLESKSLTEKVADSKFVTLKGKLSDDQKIKDLYINVNKDKVFYEAYGDKPATSGNGKEATFEAYVPLQKGVNNITVTARDNDNLFDQYRMVILYKPEEGKFDRLTLK